MNNDIYIPNDICIPADSKLAVDSKLGFSSIPIEKNYWVTDCATTYNYDAYISSQLQAFVDEMYYNRNKESFGEYVWAQNKIIHILHRSENNFIGVYITETGDYFTGYYNYDDIECDAIPKEWFDHEKAVFKKVFKDYDR